MGQEAGKFVLLEKMEPERSGDACRRQHAGLAKPGNQPRTRRRNLLALGTFPELVHMATRSRKGYWRMSQNELVRIALNNRWLEAQGVLDMRAIWIVLYYGPKARV